MIEVEIWSDFACPFCYIGKTHFEQALQQFEGRDQVKVFYRSFELDPNAPKSQKKSIFEVLAQKYGQTLEWAQKANERVVNMGAECGLNFRMDQIIPTNSFDAHRLNHLALEKGVQTQFQDSVFKAYFTEGRDIARSEELLPIGERAGLGKDEILAVLNSGRYENEVRADENQAQEYGISGVPFFLYNRLYAVSGAQPTEAFLEAFHELLRRGS